MRSLKARLVLLTMLSIAAIFGISGTAIYYFERNNLIERFDQKLRIQAYSIMTATYQKADRKVEVHFTDRFLHEFNSNQKRAFYQLWINDGEVVKRSDSLGDRDLPRQFGKEREPEYWNLVLPNGLSGRAIGVRFEPRVRGNREGDYNTDFDLILVVASDVREIHSELVGLRNLLLLGGVATLVLSPIFVFIVLSRGLAPLQELAGRMGKVDARSLETQFEVTRLPDELKPIARQLNELFGRLRESFERERRFSADVAHELRTPIAAMLNIAEVGLKWKAGESKEDYEAMRSIASEMHETVIELMDLSRADSGELELSLEPVVLEEVVLEKWKRHKELAAQRKLQVTIGDFKATEWEVDRSYFERIVENLLENAATYATEGGEIAISLSDDGSALLIENSCAGLSKDDLNHIFDRFWRKDSARSSSIHRGLGLAVVSAFAHSLGIRLVARLKDPDIFEMRLVRPLKSHNE